MGCGREGKGIEVVGEQKGECDHGDLSDEFNAANGKERSEEAEGCADSDAEGLGELKVECGESINAAKRKINLVRKPVKDGGHEDERSDPSSCFSEVGFHVVDGRSACTFWHRNDGDADEP